MTGRGAVALLVVALGCGFGCRDGIDCPDDLGLELVSPAQGGPIGLADDRSGRPGVQVDVSLRSVLQAGEPAELLVTGADGGEERHAALANDEGQLDFPLVTLPTGDVALSVHATSSRCGEDTLVTALSVLGPACALGLAEEPIASDYYDAELLNQASDSDQDAPGFQAHVEVVSEEDFEVEVFTVYGGDQTSAGITVAEGGTASLPVTLVQGQIALRAECRSTENTDSSISLPHDYMVDTVAPVCALEAPAAGTTLDPSVDEEPDPGVQFTLRGRVTGDDVAGEPTTFTAGGDSVAGSAVDADGASSALFSFERNGPFDIGFSARDHAENQCTAGALVSVNLADLWLTFDPPVADGLVGPGDGAVSGGDLDLAICGTVSEPPDAVMVSVDGGAPVAATLTGDSFCASATLSGSPPAHQVTAVALADDRQAQADIDLVVDLTRPASPGALTLTALDRQALEVAFTAPDDGESGVASYQIKIARQPFTAANFDSIGSDLPAPPPAAPGTLQSLEVGSLRAGTRYHVGAVAVDQAGNRSLLATAGPLVLRLDATGAIEAGDSNGRLGAALASGLLDGDGFSDLAVGAPLDDGAATNSGRVRLFTGGTGGLSGPPARTLGIAAAGARFGAALAVLDWNDDGESDLAVGAPGAAGGSGRVFLYFGPIDGGAADATISVAPSSPLLAGGELGTSLGAADFDGDGTDDLLIGAPGAGGEEGAAVLLFGGPSGAITIDETDPSGPAGYLIGEQAGVANGRFGEHVFGLGPTESPLDGDDDLGVAYRDQDIAFVLRGGSRRAAGLSSLAFNPAVDLRLENQTPDPSTGFAAQMVSLGDQDGDGTSDLAVGAWREGAGRVFIVRGGLSGTRQTTSNAVRSTIVGVSGVSRVGAAIADNLATPAADLDMDGRQDLILVGDAGRLQLYVFFGGSIPTGRVEVDLAPYQENGPGGFLGNLPGGALPATVAWAGDVNGDGLDDLAWADPAAAAFESLWDSP